MSASIQQIKDSMRNAWMAGDFGVVAKTISAGAEAFIERLAIPSGTRALGVACGTGNLAIPLARAGAVVTGIDIAPNLLVQARERAVEESLTIRFDEGDADYKIRRRRCRTAPIRQRFFRLRRLNVWGHVRSAA